MKNQSFILLLPATAYVNATPIIKGNKLYFKVRIIRNVWSLVLLEIAPILGLIFIVWVILSILKPVSPETMQEINKRVIEYLVYLSILSVLVLYPVIGILGFIVFILLGEFALSFICLEFLFHFLPEMGHCRYGTKFLAIFIGTFVLYITSTVLF